MQPRGGSSVPKSPERYNWLIQLLYSQQEEEECLSVIEMALRESHGFAEFPLYVKAMILRDKGRISESLTLFQSATCLNPANVANLKQLGFSLYLLGKHRQALDVYGEALTLCEGRRNEASRSAPRTEEDWELWHQSGLCYAQLGELGRAVDCFERATAVGRHDVTFRELARIRQREGKARVALGVYQDALDLSPDKPELLYSVGLTYLRLGEQQRAFDFLGNALTHDPRQVAAILAAASVIQDNGELDVALHKYRVAAALAPHLAQLWSNIGLALLGKGKQVAALACLRRAQGLDPFDWTLSYNLGLAHLSADQYSSAFHHFSAAANLLDYFVAAGRSSKKRTSAKKKKQLLQGGADRGRASTFAFLGVALSHLGDIRNSDAAFKRSLAMQNDHIARLNFVLCLCKRRDLEAALDQYNVYKTTHAATEADPDDQSTFHSAQIQEFFASNGIVVDEHHAATRTA